VKFYDAEDDSNECFKLKTTESDPEAINATHIMAIVDMQFDKETGLSRLADHSRMTLDEVQKNAS